MTLQVKHLMHRDVVKIHPETTVEKLDKMLSERRISGVPVVDEDMRVVGIVSKTDIVRLISKELVHSGDFYDGPVAFGKPTDHLAQELRRKTVGEIMERRIHSVAPDDDISRAAALMNRLRIHRLLVLDGRRVVGILSSIDLVKILENVDFIDSYYGLLREKSVK